MLVCLNSVQASGDSLKDGIEKINKTANIAQQLIITGKIVDAGGDGIPGVTVQVKGTNIRRTSNENGEYSINAGKTGVTLVFSYIGFRTQERIVRDPRGLNITLVSESTTLDNVVVIGYGTVKKPDLTGSVGQVDMTDLMEAPVGSFDEALAGRVAGVQVSSTDGQPGVGMEIVIRGANSLTQSNSPLYVIDGFPMEDPDNAAINPEEIQSINILKDASATAIYGSRAANGVIIIETKKGKVGKPVINVSANFGFQEVQKTIPMMTPWEFVNLQMRLSPSRTQQYYATSELDTLNEFYNPNGRKLEDYRNLKGTDWQNLLFRESPMQNHNVSVRGGNSKTKYSLSGSVFDQEGIILNTGSKRTQGRLTIDQTISNKLRVGITTNYSENLRFGQAVNAGGGGSFTSYLLYQAWAYRPVAGNPNLDLSEVDDDSEEYVNVSDLRFNPVVTAENDYTKTYSTSFNTNAYLEYNIFKNLKFRSTGSVSNSLSESARFYNSKTSHGSPKNRGLARQVNGTYGYGESNTWSNENTLTLNTAIKKNHKLTLLGGLSFQEGKSESFGFGTQYIKQEALGMYGLETGDAYINSSTGGEYGLMSVFGRFDYNYKSRYLVTATLRADGSSKFAPGNKWGTFPSAAFAWNMGNEQFMKGINLISESKFRFSYGETGNNRIGNYEYHSNRNYGIANSYSFNNDTAPIGGIILSKFGNPGLIWETTEQFDIGYDLGLFKNRISFTVDWYKKNTRDLLLYADMPVTTGYTRAYLNIGSVGNTGLEFSLNTTNIKTKSFTWRSSFNISFNQNKVIALTKNQESLFNLMTVGQNSANLYISRINYPAGMFYGYLFDGIYQEEDFDKNVTGGLILKSNLPTNGDVRENIEPGFIKYKDINGDGIVDTKDMTIIGRGQPLHTGGFSNNFSYKGFYLNVFLQWSYGNDIFNANRMMFDGNYINLYNVNQYASANASWTPENRSNTLFKPGGQGLADKFSNRVLEDGSYLRLKTVSLSYSIPSKIVRSLHLSKLNLRASAQNLLTFTNYSGMDPETSTRNSVLTPGFDYSPYPQARTVTFGLNATF